MQAVRHIIKTCARHTKCRLCAISGWINFATHATGFPRLFPGINVSGSVLDSDLNHFKCTTCVRYKVLSSALSTLIFL